MLVLQRPPSATVHGPGAQSEALEPAGPFAGDTAEPGVRAPAPDPQRYAALLRRRRFQHDVGRQAIEARVLRGPLAAQQRPKHDDGLLESHPSLLERDAERVVVAP